MLRTTLLGCINAHKLPTPGSLYSPILPPSLSPPLPICLALSVFEALISWDGSCETEQTALALWSICAELLHLIYGQQSGSSERRCGGWGTFMNKVPRSNHNCNPVWGFDFLLRLQQKEISLKFVSSAQLLLGAMLYILIVFPVYAIYIYVWRPQENQFSFNKCARVTCVCVCKLVLLVCLVLGE